MEKCAYSYYERQTGINNKETLHVGYLTKLANLKAWCFRQCSVHLSDRTILPHATSQQRNLYFVFSRGMSHYLLNLIQQRSISREFNRATVNSLTDEPRPASKRYLNPIPSTVASLHDRVFIRQQTTLKFLRLSLRCM